MPCRSSASSARVALTSLGSVSLRDIQLPVFELTAWQKQIVGCLFGNANPRADIPKLLPPLPAG